MAGPNETRVQASKGTSTKRKKRNEKHISCEEIAGRLDLECATTCLYDHPLGTLHSLCLKLQRVQWTLDYDVGKQWILCLI